MARQSAVPHETLWVSPSHPIMITKGSNIAGRWRICQERKPLGDALGFPFEVSIARAIKRVALTSARRSLSYRGGGRVTSISSSIDAARERVGH